MLDTSALEFDYSKLSPVEAAAVKEYLRRKAVRAKGSSFLAFVKEVWPWFVVEAVHVYIAEHFEMLREGTIDRLLINMPPRTGKSIMTSEALPAWWIGHFPTDKILHTSYALGLVEKFGRKIRNTLMDPAYTAIFPGTTLSKDSKAAAQWATTRGGEYNAAGVGGGIAGKGWNLGIVDDPTSEQEAFSKAAHDSAFEWYGGGLYTRRQPERNALCICQTRWRTDDLTGRLQEEERKRDDADKWTMLRIPAIINEEEAALLNKYADHPLITSPHHYKAGDSFAPHRWPLVEINRTLGQISRKMRSSLYDQRPTEEEGSILLRKWWQVWSGEPPKVEFVVQSYDTAFEESERSDFTARTTWGVFKHEKTGMYCAILLEAMERRLNFPDLRKNAWESYQQYKPDRVIVEKKASGHSLLQELRKRGVPIRASVAKGSKEARMDMASVPLEAGNIYYFDTKWANAVVDHCAVFPNGPHDDICFVAGTRIAMADGSEKCIETIHRGDMVATPAGPRPVTKSWCTGLHPTIMRTVGNAVLCGTQNHPIWDQNSKSWIPLRMFCDSMAPAYIGDVKCPSNLTAVLRSKWWCLMGAGIGVIHRVKRRSTVDIFRHLGGCCIETFGFFITALFPQGGTFTTRMGIGTTTASRTLNVYPLSSTFTSMVARNVHNVAVNTYIKLGDLLRRGTVVMKGGLGINFTQKKVYENPERLSPTPKRNASDATALSAGKSLCSLAGMQNSVATYAKTGTPSVDAQPVFNLDVGGEHVYYANGVLVHNCDSVAHALIWLRKTFHLDARSDRRFDKDAQEEESTHRIRVAPEAQRSYAVRRTGTRMTFGGRR